MQNPFSFSKSPRPSARLRSSLTSGSGASRSNSPQKKGVVGRCVDWVCQPVEEEVHEKLRIESWQKATQLFSSILFLIFVKILTPTSNPQPPPSDPPTLLHHTAQNSPSSTPQYLQGVVLPYIMCEFSCEVSTVRVESLTPSLSPVSGRWLRATSGMAHRSAI